MASEGSGESTIELTVPDSVRHWIRETAADLDIDEETAVRQLLIASHAAASMEAGTLTPADRDVDGDVDVDELTPEEALVYRLATTDQVVEEQLEQLRSQYRRNLDDVRQRVVQLKREIDSKASTEHEHDEIRERIEQLDERLTGLMQTVEPVVIELEAIDERIDGGFENFRTILERLIDRADEVEERLDKLATIHLRLRDDVDRWLTLADDHERLEQLTNVANQNGIRTARCQECELTVDLGLLQEPRCPSCSNRFAELVPKQGLFGKNELVIEEPPALETATGEETKPSTDASARSSDGFSWVNDR